MAPVSVMRAKMPSFCANKYTCACIKARQRAIITNPTMEGGKCRDVHTNVHTPVALRYAASVSSGEGVLRLKYCVR